MVLREPFFHFVEQLYFIEISRWIRQAVYGSFIIETVGLKKTGKFRVFMM
jgi:hypothetical protein